MAIQLGTTKVVPNFVEGSYSVGNSLKAETAWRCVADDLVKEILEQISVCLIFFWNFRASPIPSAKSSKKGSSS